MKWSWLRVSKKRVCPQCQRPDWCTISYEHDTVCCMRVPSSKPAANGGWLHKLNAPHGQIPPSPKAEEKPAKSSAELVAMYESWKPLTTAGLLSDCALELGLDPLSLHYFGWRWSGFAWAIPMYSPGMTLLGIRLRGKDGKKWSIKGSHQGLFIPNSVQDNVLMIVEGATDAAAALSIGFFAIGRPSCSGLHDMVLTFIRARKISRVILVSDNDGPGLAGSERLQKEIPVPSIRWIPPSKDLREFLKAGGTREVIESQIRDMIWEEPHRKKEIAA